jgi:putative SOS response-associated peptidase YedK
MLLPTARSEGDHNLNDDPTFRGAAGIILKKAFRKPIRSQRCIVIASAFIEGINTFGKSQPYVVYLRNQQNPFPIAGIWDTWHSPSGDTINSFSIITTTANNLLQKIGCCRMPVILTYGQAKKWINPATELTTITQMLKKYDSNLMNAYPINPAIINSNENDKKLIRPIGPKLLLEETRQQIRFPYTSGYHQAKKANKANDNSTMADRISQSQL